MSLFPYANFHDINLDWIVAKLRKAVFTINGQSPDDDGNVNLAQVSGVTTVNGVGADGAGNVQLTPADVNALPDSYSAPVQSVQGKVGNVILSASDVNAMPIGYTAPVQSVNGHTGNVFMDASDVGALPDTYAAPVDMVNGQTGNVVLSASDVSALPDTTVIPDRTSQLINDSGFITSQQAGAVLSVNGQVGAVVLDANDVSALPDTTVIPTKTSELINDAGFITSAQAAPVSSVNGQVGAVVLDAADVNAVPNDLTIIKPLLLDIIHPVGCYYWSSNNTNPGTLFGGTWTQVKDKFILAAGDTYTAGTTGGEAEHTLIQAELPNVTLGINYSSFQLRNTPSFAGGTTSQAGYGTTGGEYRTDPLGSGQAHNNMPPYEVAYCWKRTA